MGPKKCFYELLGRKIIAELKKRDMEAHYCAAREDAVKKVLELIPKGSTVSCGGSQTLRELKIRETLKGAGYEFWDPDDAASAAAKDEVAHKALGVDYYLTSANAISADGELVNIDGYGNRASSLVFGPKNVIVIAGMNKAAPDLGAAMQRARAYAALLTMLIWKKDYSSYDELMDAADAACCQTVITQRSMARGRIKVILVGEELGF